MSQNQLGRATAMDAATIKGVVGRLVKRRLVTTAPSAEDRRRLIVDLTPEGRAFFDELRERAGEATARTLAPLSPAERERFLALLRRLV
jgi:DNA-binding MarR family transcriptional regulator